MDTGRLDRVGGHSKCMDYIDQAYDSCMCRDNALYGLDMVATLVDNQQLNPMENYNRLIKYHMDMRRK